MATSTIDVAGRALDADHDESRAVTPAAAT
jgi:hypothetical protein